MPLGSIRNAYETYQRHDFSREHQFRLINMFGVPQYVIKELVEKPAGEGGVFYITTATIPGRKIVDLEVPYHGFKFHAPSSGEYDPNPWELTFKTPGDYLVRNALEAWSFDVFSDETSCGNFHIPCESAVIRLGLLDSTCAIIRVYDLVGVYPSAIGPVSYNLEGNAMTTFTASFYYQWWRVRPATDSGRVDSTSVEQSLITSTYNGYTSTITQKDDKCATLPSV